jgi:hypothetical protein
MPPLDIAPDGILPPDAVPRRLPLPLRLSIRIGGLNLPCNPLAIS